MTPLPPAPPVAAAPAAPAPPSLEDRVAALMGAGKCGQAKAAAARAGDEELAREVGDMCGQHPAPDAGREPAAAAGGGGGRGQRSGRPGSVVPGPS